VWVNRRKNQAGPGATIAANIEPDLEVASVQALADLAAAR
jgi:hypothetical protein